MPDQRPKTTRTLRALMRELYGDGTRTYKEVAELVGFSSSTVLNAVKYPGPDNAEEDDRYLSGDLEDPDNIEVLKASGLRLEAEEKWREAEERRRRAEERVRAMRLARWVNVEVPATGGTRFRRRNIFHRYDWEASSSGFSLFRRSRPDDRGQDAASSASSSSELNSTDHRSSRSLDQQDLAASPADRTEHLNHKQDHAKPGDVIVIDDSDDEETVGSSECLVRGSGVKAQEATVRSETETMAGAEGDVVADDKETKVKAEPKATEDIKINSDEVERAHVKGKAVAGNNCDFQRLVKRKVADANLSTGMGTGNTKPRVVSSSKPAVVRADVIVIEDDSDTEVGPSSATSHPGRASAGERQGSDSRGCTPGSDLCVAEEHAGVAAAIGIKTASDVQALLQLDEGEHRFIEADLHRKGFSTFDYMKFMHSLRAECVKGQSSGKK